MQHLSNPTHKFLVLSLILLFKFNGSGVAQSSKTLQSEVDKILEYKNAVVGISILDQNGVEVLNVHGDDHLPMQSVYKFHIALAVLSEVDKGKFSLNQKISFTQSELVPKTWSPIRDKYPNGGSITLAEMLKYTIAQSDNNGCDILLRLIGGPAVVENYFREHHFQDIDIKTSEEVMQKDWQVQFTNWTTPKCATEILRAYYENNQLLSKTSHQFLWKTMKGTLTGKDRLKGKLPKRVLVAHKTGTSGHNELTGVSAATNDIGIVFLNKREYFYISVFVTESTEDAATNARIIAEIAQVAYEYFKNK